MISIQVAYDTRTRNVALLGANDASKDWLVREHAAVSRLMNGMHREHPGPMTDQLLEELAQRLARLAAEKTGGQVHVRYGSGTVVRAPLIAPHASLLA